MSAKLDLEIQYSIEDYVRGLTFIQNRQFIYRYGFIILPSFLILIFLLNFVLYPDSFNQMSPSFIIVTAFPIVAIFGIFLLFRHFPTPFLRWNVRKQFRSSPILQEPQKISIDEVGIKGQTNLSAGELKWAAIIEATETKSDFFFFTSNKFAMFVAKLGLSVEQIRDIKELSKESLGDKAKF